MDHPVRSNPIPNDALTLRSRRYIIILLALQLTSVSGAKSLNLLSGMVISEQPYVKKQKSAYPVPLIFRIIPINERHVDANAEVLVVQVGGVYDMMVEKMSRVCD